MMYTGTQPVFIYTTHFVRKPANMPGYHNHPVWGVSEWTIPDPPLIWRNAAFLAQNRVNPFCAGNSEFSDGVVRKRLVFFLTY
jgi:hypothetical protein